MQPSSSSEAMALRTLALLLPLLGRRSTAATGEAPASALPKLPLGAETNFSLPGGWMSAARSLPERSARVEWALPGFTKSAELHVLPSLLSPELSESIIRTLPQQVNTDPDSVDSLPTFEFPLESFQQPGLLDTDSEAGKARAALRELTAEPIEDTILPYVRSKYVCPSCRVCTSMLRRYLPGERRRHPAHFDTQAYVTVVVSLSAFGEDFSGGLYVRRGGSGAGGTGEGDAYLPLGLGDAVAHQFDVEHGVEVGSGVRYSWIVWLQASGIHTHASWRMLYSRQTSVQRGKHTGHCPPTLLTSRAACATGRGRLRCGWQSQLARDRGIGGRPCRNVQPRYASENVNPRCSLEIPSHGPACKTAYCSCAVSVADV
jgi:hypothetical protein